MSGFQDAPGSASSQAQREGLTIERSEASNQECLTQFGDLGALFSA